MNFYIPSESRFHRHYREEVAMVFSAVDCVLNGEKAAYCSSELTTGFKLYRTLSECGLKTASELKKVKGKPWFDANIFQENVRSGCEFAQRVKAKLRGSAVTITPGPFTAPEWSQHEYLAFWETLVRTRTDAVWFNENWEFSNGCTFEFAVASDEGVSTYDHLGGLLEREQAIRLIERAIDRLDADGFDTTSLNENLRRLMALA